MAGLILAEPFFRLCINVFVLLAHYFFCAPYTCARAFEGKVLTFPASSVIDIECYKQAQSAVRSFSAPPSFLLSREGRGGGIERHVGKTGKVRLRQKKKRRWKPSTTVRQGVAIGQMGRKRGGGGIFQMDGL